MNHSKKEVIKSYLDRIQQSAERIEKVGEDAGWFFPKLTKKLSDEATWLKSDLEELRKLLS